MASEENDKSEIINNEAAMVSVKDDHKEILHQVNVKHNLEKIPGNFTIFFKMHFQYCLQFF